MIIGYNRGQIFRAVSFCSFCLLWDDYYTHGRQREGKHESFKMIYFVNFVHFESGQSNPLPNPIKITGTYELSI